MSPEMIPEMQVPWYPVIEVDACIGVRDCIQICENNVFEWDAAAGYPVVVRPECCEVGCTACMEACPVKAIYLPNSEQPEEPTTEFPSKMRRATTTHLDWMKKFMETVFWSTTWLGIPVGWLVWAAANLRALWATRHRRLLRGCADARHALWQIIIPFLAITLALPALASAQGWWWGSPINPGFDRSTVISVSGTARHVSIEARSGPATFILDSPHDTYTVMLCPGWYLAQIRADIREGDPLTVEGSKMMDRSGNLHLVAARVTNKRTGAVLELRDDVGRPLWQGGPRPGPMTR